MRPVSKVLLLGATSETGRAACLRLARAHSLSAWCQDAPAARSLLGADVAVASAATGATPRGLLGSADAVLDLSALEPGAGALPLTALAAAWSSADSAPRVLVTVTCEGSEASAPIRRSALEAIRHRGARVVELNAGRVLDPEESAFRRLMERGARAEAGRAALVPELRDPRQWIHRDDLIECAVRALADARLEGPHQASAASTELPIRHASAAAALADLSAAGCEIGPLRSRRESPYLTRRRPLRELASELILDAPLDVIFPFFSRPENLCALTPRGLGFRILRGADADIHEGLLIDYLISLGPLPMPWRTRIDKWDPPRGFVDSQLFGPYRCWWHEHAFEARGATTVARDLVLFAPLGGRLAQPLAGPQVERMLRRIFTFRARAMRLRFGAAAGAPAGPGRG